MPLLSKKCRYRIQLKRLSLAYCLIFLMPDVQATELSATLEKQQLLLNISRINYPEKLFSTELKSGLPNDISIIIGITFEGESVYATTVNYNITYDLWDELYLVSIQQGTQIQPRLQIAQQDITGFIRDFNVIDHEAIPQLDPEKTYHLQVRVLFNPVKTERINKIKAWIARSQGHTPDGEANNNNLIAANATPAARVSDPQLQGTVIAGRQNTIGSARPRFQKLFDQILEQYITEGEIPALWSSEILTLTIKLEP